MSVSHSTHSLKSIHLGILTTNPSTCTPCLSFKCWNRSLWCWGKMFSDVLPLRSGALLLCSVTFLVILNYSVFFMAPSGVWEARNSVSLGLFSEGIAKQMPEYHLLTCWKSFKILFSLLKLLCTIKKCRRKETQKFAGKEWLGVSYKSQWSPINKPMWQESNHRNFWMGKGEE